MSLNDEDKNTNLDIMPDDKKEIDRLNKEKALNVAMKIGSPCTRIIESIIEGSNKIYNFLSKKP